MAIHPADDDEARVAELGPAGIADYRDDALALEAELDLSPRPSIGIEDDDFRRPRHARRSSLQYNEVDGSSDDTAGNPT